ncbi:MAG: hypothetical protein LBB72_06350 [Spirochaetaceae bacterium]|jgi:hypothetical protein|nr:hypothetical protein [Spirochaetaceae bacterium]
MKKRHIPNKAGALKRAGALNRAGVSIAAALAVLFAAGCIIDPQPSFDDTYTSFPQAEILGASFYLVMNGKDVTGDDAGTITKNEDGTYKVRMRRRTPSNVPVAMYVTGAFEFSEFYSITCTFPKEVVNKPYRVYACASRAMDGNTDADYPTARDLVGMTAFPGGVAEGTFRMSNEGINFLNKDRRNRPYITVFLYLYFQTADNSNPEDFYEFTLHSVKGANGIMPESKAVRVEVYRDGETDAANKFILQPNSIEGYPDEKAVLARYIHRYNSDKASPDLPLMASTASLHIDLEVPNTDVGKEIEFELRGVNLFPTGLYAASNNYITRDLFKSDKVKVLAGTGGSQAEQTNIVTEERILENAAWNYYYKIKARIRNYSNLFGSRTGAGIRLVIEGPFENTDRYTCRIVLPDKYVGEK